MDESEPTPFSFPSLSEALPEVLPPPLFAGQHSTVGHSGQQSEGLDEVVVKFRSLLSPSLVSSSASADRPRIVPLRMSLLP